MAGQLSDWVSADPEKDKELVEGGIYAVILCWDSEEGFFPSALKWASGKWNKVTGKWREGYDPPVEYRSPQTFSGYVEAEAWAYEHDLEG